MLFLISSVLAAEVPAAAEGLGKGMHIQLTQSVEAPAEDAWRVLAHEYVALDSWSSMVEASREMSEADLPEGYAPDPDAPVIGRVVTTGFGEVSETLVDYDEAAMTFTFRAGGLPKMLAYSQNTHRVLDDGDGSSTITYDI